MSKKVNNIGINSILRRAKATCIFVVFFSFVIYLWNGFDVGFDSYIVTDYLGYLFIVVVCISLYIVVRAIEKRINKFLE